MVEPALSPRKVMPAAAFVPAAPPENIVGKIAGEDRNRLAELAARVFTTPEGNEMLEHLLDVTLRAGYPGAGMPHIMGDPARLGTFAAYREGQNTVVLHLLSLISQASGDHAFTLRKPL